MHDICTKDAKARDTDEPNDDVEEQNDSNFERDFLKQQRKAKKDAVLRSKRDLVQ